jgi:2-C-methyl-D-erythritol 4-phosphate cytidylyltransferase
LAGGLLLATTTAAASAEPPKGKDQETLLWSEVLGRPLLGWALRALLAVEELAELVVLVGPGKELAASDLVRAEVAGHRSVLVRPCAGPCQAVETGLGELTMRCQLVVIQEAGRPLVTPESIGRGIQVAQENPNCGAIAYVPVKETIKKVEGGVVVGTLPRERLALLQTPQVFPLDLLRSAYASRQTFAFSKEPARDPITVALWAGIGLVPFAAPGEDLLVADVDDLARAEALLRAGAA